MTDQSDNEEQRPKPQDAAHPEGFNLKPVAESAVEKVAEADDLERFMTEFDRQVKPEPEAVEPIDFKQPLSQEHAILDYLSAMEQDRRVQQERQDFEKIVERASNAVGKNDRLPPDYVRLRMEQWAKNEYVTNEDFRNAWDQRHTNPDAGNAALGTINRAISNLKREVEAIPPPFDPEATADRAAVTAAVRSASLNAPHEAPIKYGDLSDAEFKRELAKYGV